MSGREVGARITPRAQAQAERLLEEHEVIPLSDEQERELEHILRAAEHQLVRN